MPSVTRSSPVQRGPVAAPPRIGADPRLTRAQPPAERYPVVILGGGINGSGLFRDLSLQGVDCLLVDSADFCSGASAGPSRLIHGGIKYLETGEFRLVRQSTLERNLLLKNAPHYVKPIQTVLPIRSWFGGIWPSMVRFFGGKAKLKDRGIIITKLGMEMFDFYGRHHRVMPRHDVALKRRTAETFPDIAPGTLATASYYDARITHAERLGLELLLDGMAENPGSLAINHCALESAEGGTLVLRDKITGSLHRVAADVVVNAGGAWIDRVNAGLGLSTRYIGGNKGSHLILDNKRLHDALKGKMIYFGVSDGRIGLLYPLLGKVLVGSTDIPVDDPDTAVCDDDERDYMLSTLGEVFPDIPVGPEQVVYTYCGVRPLPRADGLDPGAVSRDHSIVTDTLPGTGVKVHSLIGGKWTTFRGFAEEAADKVLGDLGRKRRSSTALRPIGGGKDFPRTPAERTKAVAEIEQLQVPTARAETLLDRYGSRALGVARFCASRNDRPLTTLPDYTEGEIARLMLQECVGHAADIAFRRTDIALSGRLTGPVAVELAAVAGQAAGRSEEWVTGETAALEREGAIQHQLRFASAPAPVRQMN